MTDRPARPRVAIIDDYGPVRSGLARLFLLHGWQPIGVATAAEAFAYIGSSVPNPADVFLVDARMADGTGADVVRVIRLNHPRARVVAYTALDPGDPLVLDMIGAGADAVALKSGDFARLEAIVRGDDAGDVPIPPRGA